MRNIPKTLHADGVADLDLPNPADIRSGRAPMTMGGEVSLQAAADGKKLRRFQMEAYNGGTMKFYWSDSPVVVDIAGLQGADRSRPIFKDHAPDRIVGHTERIVLSETAITLSGVVSGSGEDAAQVVQAADNGFPWQASIGVDIERIEEIQAGDAVTVNGQDFTGPLLIVRAGNLKETSFVALGADDSTSAGMLAAARGAGAQAPEVDLAQINQTLQGLEGHKDYHFVRAAAEAGAINTQDLNRKALDMLRESRPKMHGITVPGASDNITDVKATATAHMLCQLGKSELAEREFGAEVCQAAAENYDPKGHSILEVARNALMASGSTVPSSPVETLRAAWGNIDLPGIMSNIAGRLLLSSYQQHAPTWQSFGKVVPAQDFKPKSYYRSYLKSGAAKVPAGGEIKQAGMGEESYQTQLETYAEMISIDRQMLINDDLSALDQIATMFARDLSRKLSNTVYTVVNGAEGAGHYTAGRGNLLEAGSALSVSSLSQAVTALRLMEDEDGMPLDLQPSTLLVSPALETTAREILSSSEIHRMTTVADTTIESPTGNAMQGIANLVVEPRLQSSGIAGSSPTQWFLMASTADCPYFVSFLGGNQNPTVETSDADFQTLGVQIRCFHDWDSSLGDWRASIKATGAA